MHRSVVALSFVVGLAGIVPAAGPDAAPALPEAVAKADPSDAKAGEPKAGDPKAGEPTPGEAKPAVKVRWAKDRVTADVKDAPLGEVLPALAKEAGAELHGTPPDRKVTVTLDDVSTEEAMQRLLGDHNFTLTYGDTGLKVIELKGAAEELQVPPPAPEPPGRSVEDFAPPGWNKIYEILAGKKVPISGPLAQSLGKDQLGWDEAVQTAYVLGDPFGRNEATRAALRALENDPALRDALVAATANMTDEQIAEYVRAACRDLGKPFLRAVVREANDTEIRRRAQGVLAEVRKADLAGVPLPFGKAPPPSERH